METHLRTLIKALTWRLGGLLLTVAVVWLLTGRAELALSAGLADTLVKLGAFYLHERLWLRVAFGRSASPEYPVAAAPARSSGGES